MPRNWYYWSGNREVGPLTLQELTHIAAQKRIDGETRVRHGKEGAWIPAKSVVDLFPIQAKSNQTGPVVPPPLPRPLSEPSTASVTPSAALHRRYLVFGISVCVLLAIVAICMTLYDRQEIQDPLRPKNIPGATPISTARSNWIARLKDKATHSVVIVVSASDSSIKLGSGFVLASRAGRNLVVTNKHVLAGGDFGSMARNRFPQRYLVVDESGDRISGQLAALASDRELDLALLLVKSNELEPLGPIASFDDVSVGDDVVSVGTPIDPSLMFNTVNKGIVSGKRNETYVQTSAAINHGNSGGPLVDQRGRILGVNTLKVTTENAEGLGFAIRADLLLRNKTWDFQQDVSDLFDQVSK